MEKNRIAFCEGVVFSQEGLPAEFLLLSYGKNVFSKNGEHGEFEFTEHDADLVLADFSARGKDLVIDYEHQSLDGGKAPAAGWIDRLSKCTDGLAAHVKYWTDEAARYLAAGEYRYFSPTLYFSRTGRNVSAIHSVALTNHPALYGIPALAATDESAAVEGEAGNPECSPYTKQSQERKEDRKPMKELMQLMDLDEKDFSDGPQQIQAVRQGVERLIELKNDVSAFLETCGFADLSDAAERIAKFYEDAEKCASLEQEIRSMRSEKLVAQAFRDGKLTEAERSWAETFAEEQPEAFREWCNGAPRRLPDNKDLDEKNATTDPSAELTEDERRIYKMLGIDPEQKSK